MKRQAGETRLRLLSAAESVVRLEGVANLTLEAVARTAGLSKGGLLYHFPDKQALVAAMVERVFLRLRAEHEALLALEPSGPGRWLRAYVRGSFAPIANRDVTSALLAGMIHDPAMLRAAQDEFAYWRAQALADGLRGPLVMTVLLAADGYWFGALFGTQALGAEQADAVLQELLTQITVAAS